MSDQAENTLPRVTVLMPVFNTAAYLRDAVDSILEQSFRDFELLAIDDGSTDESLSILRSYLDPRLRIIEHTKNRGLVATLNEGIELCRTEYIARMDGDDIMLPNRLQEQVDHLEAHTDLAAANTFVDFINSEGEVTGEWDVDRATPNEASVKAMMPRTNCIAHPSMMIRRGALGKLRYDPRPAAGAEDWDLWLRMLSRGLRIGKIPKVLLQYRVHSTSVMGRSKQAVPYEIRLLRSRRSFLFGELKRGKFATVQLAVLLAQIRTLARHLLHNVLVPFMRSSKRVLTYSPIALLRERRALELATKQWSGRIICMFPYTNAGGAEQVHADILATVEDERPLIVICGFSSDGSFRSTYASLGKLLELPRLLNHPFTRSKANDTLAKLINAQERAVLFSSNTTTFFELLPALKDDVRTFHLQHAFLYQPAGNLQHQAWLRHFNDVDRYVFVGEQVRSEFQRFLFANHIPRSRFNKLLLIGNSVKHFGQVNEHERLGLLFVGRPSEEKRTALFLAICDKLERNQPGRFRFTMVGPSTINGHPHVKFKGLVVDAADLSAIYAEHDMLLLTSYREGSPVVIMEAMANGLIPLSTPVGDVPNSIDETFGLVTSSVEAATVLEEMTSAVVALDVDRERITRMKNAALTKAKAEFRVERFNESYRELLIKPAS